MVKYILTIGIAFFVNYAFCQKTDTTMVYLKYNVLGGIHTVKTKDSADFIRVITPPDLGDDNENVIEFYKNGKTKLIGKYDNEYYKETKEWRLIGDCRTYFQSGKRQSITKYIEGFKVDDEYLFYPNGNIYCYIKNIYSGKRFIIPDVFKWECYDQNGVKICSEGNGRWMLFNENFKLLLEGGVKKGLFEGDWHGATMKADSITYVYKFKEGKIISGIGYDKYGKAYPFIHDVEAPGYKVTSKNWEVSPFVFVRILKNHLKVPIDANGNKMNLDTAHIAFTIEKDGTLTNAEIIGNTEPEIKVALKSALDKSGVWTPRTYFGLPIRSRITLNYKTMADYKHGIDKNHMLYKEEMFGFSLETGYAY